MQQALAYRLCFVSYSNSSPRAQLLPPLLLPPLPPLQSNPMTLVNFKPWYPRASCHGVHASQLSCHPTIKVYGFPPHSQPCPLSHTWNSQLTHLGLDHHQEWPSGIALCTNLPVCPSSSPISGFPCLLVHPVSSWSPCPNLPVSVLQSWIKDCS